MHGLASVIHVLAHGGEGCMGLASVSHGLASVSHGLAHGGDGCMVLPL